MLKQIALAALAAASLVAPSAARAQAAAPPTDVSPLVVTPTLTATPIDQVGSSITLITADQIEAHQWRTLPDALNTAPGLNVLQTGGPGGLTSVFIRGANSNHTEVIIDGIEVNDPSQNAAYDFGQGLAFGLERIEILRGPQSSLYGAEALGGVINIVTPAGEGRPRLIATLEGGSFDTFNQQAGLTGAQGPVHYALGVSHFHSGDTPVTPPGLLQPGEAAIGDRYDNLTATAKLRYDLTRAARLGIAVRYVDTDYRSTGENFDVFPAIPDAVQTVQHERQFFVRGDGELDLFEGRLNTVTGVAYANFRTTIQSPDDGFGLPAPVIDNADRLKVDELATVVLDPRNTLLLGADATVDRLIDSPASATETRSGGFAELQSRPIPGLSLAASARYDSDDRFGDKATWRFAPAYTIAATGTVLKASVGTGYKAPTLTELFVSFPAFNFFANPDLKPETSLGYDVGFEQPALDGAIRFGATWFHNDIRDLIETNASGTSWENIGRATTYGVESFIAVKATSTLELRGNYTWLIARDDVAQEELLRRPKNKASLTATWQATRRLRLAASLVYVGAWVDGNRDFSIERLTTSPYATVDLAGDYDLGHGLTLFARIDNLLDRHYENPVGFDKPGIGAFGGVRLALQ
ncbi:MAG TPA: TonB-dependent receptor, partial [Caulobacteraceae bacterium]